MVAKSKKTSTKTRKPSKKVKASVSKTSLPRVGRGEPASMETLLEKYGSDSSGLERGQKVTGIIKEITPKRVVVDIGGKADGIVAEAAFNEAKDYIKTLEVGDEIAANVIISEMPDGSTILSFRHAAANASWEKIENSKKKGTAIVVFGKSSRSSGIMVDLDSLMGFIPTSQLGEESAKEISKTREAQGLEENKQAANRGGKVASVAREAHEKETDNVCVAVRKQHPSLGEFDSCALRGCIRPLLQIGRIRDSLRLRHRRVRHRNRDEGP